MEPVCSVVAERFEPVKASLRQAELFRQAVVRFHQGRSPVSGLDYSSSLVLCPKAAVCWESQELFPGGAACSEL